MRCAGNMYSSYYKWNMAIICNPPIMLCATFVPCFIIIIIYLMMLMYFRSAPEVHDSPDVDCIGDQYCDHRVAVWDWNAPG